jgi:hypothetical protein
MIARLTAVIAAAISVVLLAPAVLLGNSGPVAECRAHDVAPDERYHPTVNTR